MRVRPQQLSLSCYSVGHFVGRLMGNVRKKMPKDLKGDAMLYRNNITFDLIAVNKAARVEDKSKAFEVRAPSLVCCCYLLCSFELRSSS